jgi:hypothetical protein
MMTDRVTIRISADLAEALDRFMASDVAVVRSRQDAFRHIVGIWLTDQGYMPDSTAAPPTGATLLPASRS